jgi:plastocyanin
VVAGVAGNATGAFAAAPFAVAAVLLALVLRLTGRGLVAAIVISALLFLIFLDFGAIHLQHPESFADFVPAVLRLAGAAVAIVGTAVARAQWRRGTFAAQNPRRRRVLVAGAAGLVAVAAISGVLTAAERQKVHAVAGAIVVNLRDDTFSPGRLDVHPGERVRVLARNIDSYSHSFTIDDLDVDEYMGPGAERLITFRIPADAGRRRYVLNCTVTGHENMLGTIRVG